MDNLVVLFLAFSAAVNSKPINVGDVQEKDREALRAETISMAQCAIDSVFPYGADRDSYLEKTQKTLQDMLDKLPNASYAERDGVAKDAYAIRLELEGPYKYSYALAAHSVAMAANVGTTVSEHGHKWSKVFTGDKDAVSYELTKETVEGTEFWNNRRDLSRMNCLKPVI